MTFVTNRSLHPNYLLPTIGLIPLPMANQRERVRDPSIDGTATLHPLPGDNSTVAPPDPIPNSEVKHSRADGSVA